MSTFPGIIPAVVVPFSEDDSIDVDALRLNTGHLIDGGVHGLVVNGTMGEAATLSDDERGLVIDTIVELAGGRLPVTVGVSSASTRASCAYAEQARDRGAQAVMCLPPLLYPGTTEELVAHFNAVSETAGLPVMAYNNPEASGIDLTPERIAAIASAVPGVVGVKECSGDARRIARCSAPPTSRCSWAATTGRSRDSPRAPRAGCRAWQTSCRRIACSCATP